MDFSKEDYRICVRCVMDISDPDIEFDEKGICNNCRRAESIMKLPPYSLSVEEKTKEILKIVEKIKKNGKGKSYDCIVGVSGGVDSTYVLYKVCELGLRPLAVHLDNGWNTPESVSNIKNATKKLGVDLYNFDCSGEEFTDIQIAFLLSSTPDCEIPTDHALAAFLYKMAKKHNLKYIIAGTNIATESILPPSWSHGHNDWKYIRYIHKRFGVKSDSIMHRNLIDIFVDAKIRRITWIHLLNYLDYNKKEAKEIITNKLSWKDYGAKHHESIYTRFLQAYILPQKFGYDKRRAHLSSLILSGQMSRDEALKELERPPYPNNEMLNADGAFVLKKLALEDYEFEHIMSSEPKSFKDYPSYENSFFWSNTVKTYRLFKRVL